MKIKELKEILNNCNEEADIYFCDVCGNWTFDLYSTEKCVDNYGNENLIIIGDDL